MDAPLYNKIKALTGGDVYPLHMPGHKRTGLFMEENLLSLDITEVEGADNMHHPDGAILQAEERLAGLNKCDRSLFLINGGSGGLLTALLGTLDPGDRVIMCRNAHKSAHNGLVLSGAMPYYLHPQVYNGYISTTVTPQALAESFTRVRAKAVLITSPTYEGYTSPMGELAEICHKNKALLIVDETHGAHFAFNSAFPKTAMEQGADISINSWHKTLPCVGQGAVLNYQKKGINEERLLAAYSMVQSTSPSYIIMASIDRARAILTESPGYFNSYVALLRQIRQRLGSLKGLRLAGIGLDEQSYDISKLVLFTGENLSGKALAQRLLKEYNIQIELEGLHHIIAMTSVADTPQGLHRFAEALEAIDSSLPPYKAYKGSYSPCSSRPLVSPREVYYAPFEYVPYNRATGRVAAGDVTPFPPDIPLIAPGEIIEAEAIGLIEAYKEAGTLLLGMENNKIKVMKEK